MTRWGAAVGIGAETRAISRVAASDQELRFAQDLLEQIRDCFGDADKKSQKYKSNAMMKPNEDGGLDLQSPDAILDTTLGRLHLTMREIAHQRQKNLSFVKKVTWALYEKKRFDTMIDDINNLVTKLIDLFPASVKDQEVLCKEEIAAIKHPEDLSILKDVASKNDKILQDLLKNKLGSRGHKYEDIRLDDSYLWAGDENGVGVPGRSHQFSRLVGTNKAELRLGDVNRGL